MIFSLVPSVLTLNLLKALLGVTSYDTSVVANHLTIETAEHEHESISFVRINYELTSTDFSNKHYSDSVFLVLHKTALRRFEEGNHLGSIQYLLKADSIKTDLINQLYLAHNYRILKEYSLAKRLYQKLINKPSINDEHLFSARFFYNLIISKQNPIQGIGLYETQLLDSTVMRNKSKMIQILNQLSKVNLLLADTIEAKSYLLRAIELSRNNHLKADLSQSLILAAKILEAQNELDSAAKISSEAFVLELQSADNISLELLRLLFSTYKQQEDTLVFKNIGPLFRDRLLSEIGEGYTSFIIRSESNEKDENNLASKYIYVYVIILVIIILTIYYFYNFNMYSHILRFDNHYFNTVNLSISNESIIRSKLESHFNITLNETNWRIVQLILKDPYISIDDIAQNVFLSRDGVKTSLKTIYRAFKIGGSWNKKIMLNQLIKNICHKELESKS